MGSEMTISSSATGAVAPSAKTIGERLEVYAHQARGAFSTNTERALRNDTAVFAAWCGESNATAFPAMPETVVQFVDAMSDSRKPATIRRYLASLSHQHRAAELPDPTKTNVVRLAIKRSERKHGIRQRQAAPFGEMLIERVFATLGTRLIDLRDLSLLLVTRDMLARRSEVVALEVEDITVAEDGSGTVLVRKSKTDQSGEGAVLWIAPQTVAVVQRWLEAAGITSGPIFRSVGKAGRLGAVLDSGEVARIFKKLAKAANIDAANISGHSARVGMAQDLVAHGAGLPEVMQAGRWKSPTMPARYAERLVARRGAVAQYYGRRVG